MGKSEKDDTGTLISFLPDADVFEELDLSAETLAQRVVHGDVVLTIGKRSTHLFTNAVTISATFLRGFYERVAEKVTKFRDIACCGGICCNHKKSFTDCYFAYFFMQ